MGCDIHGVWQRVWQQRRFDKWVDVAVVDRTRNYSLFGVLAGVRRDEHGPIVPPRGYPPGFPLDENNDHPFNGWDFMDDQPDPRLWMGDHSHTWLTLGEIMSWDGWDAEDIPGVTLRESCGTFLAQCEYMRKIALAWPDSQIRLVIGFDN